MATNAPIVASQNNAIIFAAVLGLGVYAVYAVGDLQSVIYAVCGAYSIRLLLRNPNILKQAQAQFRNLSLQLQGQRPFETQTQTQPQPQLRPQVYTYDSHGQPIGVMPQESAYSVYQAQQQALQGQPRLGLDMTFIEAPQPQVHNVPEPSFLDELARSPNSTHSHQESSSRSRASDEFPIPTRNPYGSYSHYDAGTVNGERVSGGRHAASGSTGAPIVAPTSSAGRTAAFPIPARNPYGSYSHYDAGTIGGERVAPHAQVPVDVTAEDRRKIPTPPARPDSAMSNPAEAFLTAPVKNPYGSYSHYDNGTVSGQKVSAEKQLNDALATPTGPNGASLSRGSSNAAQKSTRFSPEATAKEEYVFKRKHRMPTISDRVPGMSPLPGAGMVTSTAHLKASSGFATSMMSPSPIAALTLAPTPAPSHSSRPSTASTTSLTASQLVSFQRQVLSPKPVPVPVLEPLAKLLDSPLLQSPSGYDSDSSHASSSSGSGSGKTRRSGRPGEGHYRSESTASSLGVPTYEKHATAIFTLVPKRPGYVPQIQAILKSTRNDWLNLPGTVTHEVGQDDANGSVVVVETYESTEAMNEFERSDERGKLLTRLKNFVDESKTNVVRLPASSAATRVVR